MSCFWDVYIVCKYTIIYTYIYIYKTVAARSALPHSLGPYIIALAALDVCGSRTAISNTFFAWDQSLAIFRALSFGNVRPVAQRSWPAESIA